MKGQDFSFKDLITPTNIFLDISVVALSLGILL